VQIIQREPLRTELLVASEQVDRFYKEYGLGLLVFFCKRKQKFCSILLRLRAILRPRCYAQWEWETPTVGWSSCSPSQTIPQCCEGEQI